MLTRIKNEEFIKWKYFLSIIWYVSFICYIDRKRYESFLKSYIKIYFFITFFKKRYYLLNLKVKKIQKNSNNLKNKLIS